jgi:hypothetical protein
LSCVTVSRELQGIGCFDPPLWVVALVDGVAPWKWWCVRSARIGGGVAAMVVPNNGLDAEGEDHLDWGVASRNVRGKAASQYGRNVLPQIPY